MLTNAKRIEDPAKIFHGGVVQLGRSHLVSCVRAETQTGKGNCYVQRLADFPYLDERTQPSWNNIALINDDKWD